MRPSVIGLPKRNSVGQQNRKRRSVCHIALFSVRVN